MKYLLIIFFLLFSNNLLANTLNGKGISCYHEITSSNHMQQPFGFVFEENKVILHEYIFETRPQLKKIKLNFESSFHEIKIKYEDKIFTISRKPSKALFNDKKKYKEHNFVSMSLDSKNSEYGRLYMCIVTNSKNDFYNFFNEKFFMKKNIL